MPDLQERSPQTSEPGVWTAPPALKWLPALLALGLAALALTDGARRIAALRWSLIGAALALLMWQAVLQLWPARRAPRLSFELRRQHYLQACAQGTVLLYWGWYWRPVYERLPLLIAQLLFAYGVDMLLSWSRRNCYALGLGPFPVIFSINLFLWFAPEWFAFQLLMVAGGFAAKELIRWRRDGRQVHIFNPSSFPLAVASVILILTASSDITRGQDIAISQFYPPQMYLLLFLVGLPGQFFFGVASMTLAAVLTTYLFGLAYFAVSGTYFFLDSYVPIAVFLGMHLLFTDPSTSPRTELGRMIFGVLYGLSAVALYRLLIDAGLPAFYDKLLQVPLLNLSVRAIDRAARSPWLARLDPARLGRSLAPYQRHAAYMSVWAAVFTAMSLAGGVGDDHRGQWLPFWDQACRAGRERACDYLVQLESILCGAGSGWACNEAAVRERLPDGAAAGHDQRAFGGGAFDRGCQLGFVAACRNAGRAARGQQEFERPPPALADYAVLLRGSKGPITTRAPQTLYARACELEWPGTCELTGRTTP
jgi:hypothetical protein